MKIHARPLPRDIPEKDFARTFEEMAHTFGWRLAHFRNSLNARGHHQTAVGADGKGWPDYYAVHPASGDHFAAELKTRYNKATDEQAAWGEWLTKCGTDWHLWYPTDWPEIVTRLASTY